MKGDFSRLTFDVTKHFRRVMMQQGRVQLDADWNELTAILLHYMQSIAMDLIGEHGGPKTNCGFEIKKMENISNDFQILNGHYYVDGILAEQENKSISIEVDGQNNNELKLTMLTINNALLKKAQYLEVKQGNDFKLVNIGDINQEKSLLTVVPSLTSKGVATTRRAITYTTQEDYPIPPPLEQSQNYLVYLDIWERHISYIEDDSIREVALGGVDTATRAKLVRQVKITNKYWDNNAEKDIPNRNTDWKNWLEPKWVDWVGHWQPANRGMLKAQAKESTNKDTDPCTTAPEASYRGTENQLFRIEIHQAGLAWDGKANVNSSTASFKWSRDNGSFVTGITLQGVELTVDNVRGLSVGKWLELTNDNQELRGKSGLLFKIKNIDCEIITLDATGGSINAPNDVPQTEVWPSKARLWESDALPFQEAENITGKDSHWITLADGIQIQFQKSLTDPQHHYRIGDYWLVPVRVATGDVEWPGLEGHPEALSPNGVEHHYAPLAILEVGDEPTKITDLRKQFESLAKNN